MSAPLRIVLLGSGPFAIPVLERLQEIRDRIELLRVVTRPDRPARRGRQITPTPVRLRATQLGVSSDAPEDVNDPACLEALSALRADLLIVADFGQMLRRQIRELPRIGAFNLHASLLPRHRGAAPVAHAILAGDRVTGVTLFRIERGLDSGPMVDSEEVPVDPFETAGDLEARLATVAADLLRRNIEPFANGTFRETPQDESRVTLAPKLEKAGGLIDWNTDAERLKDFVRAMNPWPVAYSFLRLEGKPPERTSFLRVRPASTTSGSPLPPGSVEDVRKDGFTVRCCEGSLDVLEIQREGRAPLDAGSYLRGHPLRRGDLFARA